MFIFAVTAFLNNQLSHASVNHMLHPQADSTISSGIIPILWMDTPDGV